MSSLLSKGVLQWKEVDKTRCGSNIQEISSYLQHIKGQQQQQNNPALYIYIYIHTIVTSGFVMWDHHSVLAIKSLWAQNFFLRTISIDASRFPIQGLTRLLVNIIFKSSYIHEWSPAPNLWVEISSCVSFTGQSVPTDKMHPSLISSHTNLLTELSQLFKLNLLVAVFFGENFCSSYLQFQKNLQPVA